MDLLSLFPKCSVREELWLLSQKALGAEWSYCIRGKYRVTRHVSKQISYLYINILHTKVGSG